MLRLALLLGISLMLPSLANAQENGPTLEVGKPLPVVSLPTMRDGEPMSIADHRGKRVVLHVFASW